MSQEMPSRETLDCMKLCGECGGMCLQCSFHCLHMGGQHASPEHQCLMHDCADICNTVACFMARNSQHAPHLCAECAEICNQCAAACDKLANGDPMMKQCADLCRKCAQACEKMAGAPV